MGSSGVVSVTRWITDDGLTEQASNIVPEKITLGGTVRTFSEKDMKYIKDRMYQILVGVKLSGNMKSVSLKFGDEFSPPSPAYPAVINDPKVIDSLKNLVVSTDTELNDSNRDEKIAEFYEDMTPITGGEDFAFFQKVINFW